MGSLGGSGQWPISLSAARDLQRRTGCDPEEMTSTADFKNPTNTIAGTFLKPIPGTFPNARAQRSLKQYRRPHRCRTETSATIHIGRLGFTAAGGTGTTVPKGHRMPPTPKGDGWTLIDPSKNKAVASDWGSFGPSDGSLLAIAAYSPEYGQAGRHASAEVVLCGQLAQVAVPGGRPPTVRPDDGYFRWRPALQRGRARTSRATSWPGVPHRRSHCGTSSRRLHQDAHALAAPRRDWR